MIFHSVSAMSSSWKWSSFCPKVTQSDKRDRDGLVTKGEKFVERNFNELGLSSFVAVPVVDKDRNILQVRALFPPKSPLETFWNAPEQKPFVLNFIKAMQDTQLFALELWDAKDQDQEHGGHTFEDRLGLDDEEEEATEQVPKPEKPIFSMNKDEISMYFGILLKFCYKREKMTKYKLWVKKSKSTGEVLEEATDLEIYDAKAKKIMPREDYWGRGSGGPNVAMRMKMVSGYILSKLEKDHNLYCEVMPPLYKPVEVDFERADMMDHDLVDKATKSKKPASRLMKAKLAAAKVDKHKPQLEIQAQLETIPATPVSKKRGRQDMEGIFSKRARIQSSESEEDISVQSPVPMARLRTPAVHTLRFEGFENSPGTPVEEASDNEDGSDPLINQNIDSVVKGNVKKAHAGGITTVNVFDVEVCPTNGYYRASISDGKDLSNKVLFESKLNERVKKELVGEGRVSVIKLEQVDVLEDCIIGVLDFTKLEEGPHHVGQARFVGDAFYRNLKPRGIFTPSRMRKQRLFK